MKISVVGLWHLGTVTAACLADKGHQVTAIDSEDVIAGLNGGELPVQEPGLAELIRSGKESGHLQFTDNPANVADCEVVWITYDTPVDENDRADVDFVVDRVKRLFPHLSSGTLVLISSQVPIGTTARLESDFEQTGSDKNVHFAYSPENLRLGKAIEVFTQPDRFVIGTRNDEDRQKLRRMLEPITDQLEWMSVESAEMTKHATNAFLATSIVFINNIATLCQQVGADASEVARGLKTDIRIGPKAYLNPGPAFAGGTLARDVEYLTQNLHQQNLSTDLFQAVQRDNETHKDWPVRRLAELLGDVSGHIVAVWGLTYKSGTNTLRRSNSIRVCRKLHEQGAKLKAFDPAISQLPEEIATFITLCDSPSAAVEGADGLVVMTEWPEFRQIKAEQVVEKMKQPLVLDANGFLREEMESDGRIQYLCIGKALGT